MFFSHLDYRTGEMLLMTGMTFRKIKRLTHKELKALVRTKRAYHMVLEAVGAASLRQEDDDQKSS